MFNLIKKSLISKEFYQKEYKHITRTNTIKFILLIALIYTLLVSPLSTFITFKQYEFLKTQVKKLPAKFEIIYTNENGLQTNINSPLVIETSENSLLVIDPNSKYNKHSENKSEIVLRNKGFILYENGRTIDQNSYQSLQISNFRLTGEQIKNDFFAISNNFFIAVAFVSNLFLNFIANIINVSWVVLTFGSISYAINRFLGIKKTLLQHIKMLLFLSVFISAGMALNTLILGAIPILDIILFGIGYLFLTKNK